MAGDRIHVESLQGTPQAPGRLSTTMQVAGLDVTKGALLIHDGRRAEVCKVSEDNSLTLVSKFEAPVGSGEQCSMALYGDSVYRTAGSRVEVCNFAGMSGGYTNAVRLVAAWYAQQVMSTVHHEHACQLAPHRHVGCMVI